MEIWPITPSRIFLDAASSSELSKANGILVATSIFAGAAAEEFTTGEVLDRGAACGGGCDISDLLLAGVSVIVLADCPPSMRRLWLPRQETAIVKQNIATAINAYRSPNLRCRADRGLPLELWPLLGCGPPVVRVGTFRSFEVVKVVLPNADGFAC
jgi:hypothetical protein